MSMNKSILGRRTARQRDHRRKLLRERSLGGHLRFEPLEGRLMMAADLGFSSNDQSLLDYQQATQSASQQSALAAEGEALVAEGEDAPDLVAFAKALAAANVKFYGAFWCPHCRDQKALFEDGKNYLPYIEVSNPDRTLNQTGIDNNISTFPTWEFPGGQRVTGTQTLETLSQLSGVAIPTSSNPSFVTIPDTTVAIGSPMHIVVDAYDPNGNPLTITATSSNPSVVSATVSQSNPSLKVDVHNFGEMVFQLFEDKAPRAVGRVEDLVSSGFYDAANNDPDIGFHRVINNFVIQFGDPTGTGGGGSSLGDFDDQYNTDLQHNRTGVLSYAKSSDDTNDSQMFVTEGAQRSLDFNHSIVGQLMEGEAVRQAISNVTTDANDKPTTAVVIDSMSIFDDQENGLVLLKATGGTGTADVTVTVTDSEGNSVSQVVKVTVVADTSNSAPFLADISTLSTPVNTPITFNLQSTDVEGDAVFYDAAKSGNVDYTFDINNDTGAVTVTPPTGFTGAMQVLVGVRGATAADTVDQFDTQLVTINVTSGAPTGIDLLANSDTGISNSDNITNASTLQFQVTGVQSGALVKIKAGGTVIGQATASSSTVTIPTTNLAALGDGTHTITATQTVSNVESAASPSISVTLDTTVPSAFTSTAPTQVNAGQNLNYNVQHSEEGTNGFRYSLTNTPTGATINETTGVVTWTPTANQIGNRTFQVVATDAAGNTATQAVNVEVVGEVLAQFRLEATDEQGNPITAVNVGDEFLLNIYVEDLRGLQGTGLFAAYLDVIAQNGLIEPVDTSPITHATDYIISATGTVASAGVIDELGGAANSQTPFGPEERLLATVRYVATASGTEVIDGDPADSFPASDTLFYGGTSPVPTSQISYGSESIQILLGFGANDDVFNFDEDTSNNTLDVLANDRTESGAALTVTAVGSTSNGGTVTIASDGKSLRYTPAANYNGEEFFTYTVSDGGNTTDTATVIVQVQPVNDPPTAVNDTFTAQQGSTDNFFDVLANDLITPDSGETLRVASLGTPSAGGSVRIGSSGTHVLYTPASGLTGQETFTYTVSDGNGGTSTATVTVNGVPANDPPTVVNESFTVQEDAAQASFDVLANDSTADAGETLTIASVGTASQGGQVSLSTNKLQLQYKPAANFSGTETVTYVVDDSRGGTATGTATFTVTGVNDPPTATDDTLTALSGTAATVLDVLANDSIVPDTGETLTITNVSATTNGGTVAITNNGTRVSYTPPNGTFEGTDTFTYTISDGNGGTDTASVTVNVLDYTPRDIGGVITTDSSVGMGLAGFEISLSGTDTFGETVSMTAMTGADGKYVFNDLAPGNYTLTRTSLPFLTGGDETLQVNSGENDSDSLNNSFTEPSRRAEFIDVRDFLGSTPQQTIMAAVTPGAASDGQAWYRMTGSGWTGISNVEVQLSADLSIVTINATRNGTAVQATLSGRDARAVQFLGQDGNDRLLRIAGPASAINFQPVTSTASTQAAAEGEADSTAGGVAAAFAVASNDTTTSGNSAASNTSNASASLTAEGESNDSASIALAYSAATNSAPQASVNTVTSTALADNSLDRSSNPLMSLTASSSLFDNSLLPYDTVNYSTDSNPGDQSAGTSLDSTNASLAPDFVDEAIAEGDSDDAQDWRYDSAEIESDSDEDLNAALDELFGTELAES
ncbi:MAG: tandem-95 repeat protein [Pirellulaceae bacterium]